MDTKLKSSSVKKGAGLFITFVILSLLATAVLFFYKPIEENAQGLVKLVEKNKEEQLNSLLQSEQKIFLQSLFRGNYVLQWELERQKNNKKLDASQVFLSSSLNSDSAFSSGSLDTNSSEEEQRDDSAEEGKIFVYPEVATEGYDYTEAEPYGNGADYEAFVNDFTQLMNNWNYEFFYNDLNNYQLEYYAADDETGLFLTNTGTNLAAFATNNTEEMKALKEAYAFYTVVRFEKDGSVRLPLFHGILNDKKEEYFSFNITQAMVERSWVNPSWFASRVKGPADMTVVYAVKSKDFLQNNYLRESSYLTNHIVQQSFEKAGGIHLFIVSVMLVVLLGFLLPAIKPLGIGNGIGAKIPLEIWGAGVLLSISFYVEGFYFVFRETMSGDLLRLNSYNILNENAARVVSYFINILIWLLIFLIWFAAALSVRELFRKRPLKYIQENMITGKLLRWLCGKIKRIYRYASSIEMNKKDNRKLLLILGANMLLLILFCAMWGVGIIGVILYTCVLFYIINKHKNRLASNYRLIMEAAESISEGNLDITIEGDLGVFNPLKEELLEVQKGFKRAVLEETRSQKMKTELITNVSHDLKTPLTAIITYVDLLKDENLTKEQRDSYIETLDRKALRLKILIDDLFEMSKAASNTIVMNPVEVDLTALIKQVQFELSDRIAKADIDLRVRMPEEKVMVFLDSDKTYRIFENLLINMSKYALPGSRAYLDMELKEKKVFVTVRNISQAELDFTGEEITERFVRGDKARNSEGSGLGLAIAKSFTGLQGGSFQVITDGDLFKVIIGFETIA